MRTTIRDQGTFEGLQPLDVVRYLRVNGWREESQNGDRASTWLRQTSTDDEHEILLPLQRSLGDYALRMADVFRTLELAEERSQTEILQDVLTAGSDIIRVRLFTDRSQTTLPIEDAVLATNKAKEMMLAAACAAVEPRQYYHARKFDDATNYVRRLRFGQSEAGSYVFTIHSRVPPALQLPVPVELEDDLDAPFERTVTYTLASGLEAAYRAANRAAAIGDIAPFEDAVQHGVSANLCDALVGLGGTDGTSTFEISLSFSPSRQAPSSVPRSIQFSPDVLPLFEEATRVFKHKSPQDDFELEGVVVQMKQEDEPSEPDSRAIQITGSVEGKMRKVELSLPEEDFDRAVEAFKARSTVRVHGKLTRTGNRFVLRNARSFEVLSEDD